jgi:hypothetical protein
MNLKKMSISILIGAVIILAIRKYGIYMANNSFEFGCNTATQKVMFYNPRMAYYLHKFCKQYSDNIRREVK